MADIRPQGTAEPLPTGVIATPSVALKPSEAHERMNAQRAFKHRKLPLQHASGMPIRVFRPKSVKGK
jgi:hypothetical protein